MSRLRLGLLALAIFVLPVRASAKWVAVFYAAPFPATPVLAPIDVRDYDNAAVRQEVVANAGGKRIRVRMTNALGESPLHFESASLTADGRALPILFGGRGGATIPAGASLLSDPVAVNVRAFEQLAITVRYGAGAKPAAHLLPVSVTTPDGKVRTGRGPALAAEIDVDRSPPTRVIVALGDSITEGARASAGAYTGWPERFARRLAESSSGGWVVVNAGISGNRLLRPGAGPDTLARFDRDVLAIPGVTDVILLEGINDIGWGNAKPATDGPVTAEDVIGAYRQIIVRAHAHRVRVIAGTLIPYRGSVYYTPAGESVREAVNRWIRTSGAFDAVVDFDKAMADPAHPLSIDPAKDPGDHLHPNDTGYAAMAAAIDPRLLAP